MAGDGASVRIRLAGGIALERADRVATERDLPGRQLRAAFAYLVLERGRVLSHDELAEALWPSGPPATWQPALRSIVSKVRAFLHLGGLDAGRALEGEAGRYQLTLPPGTQLDVEVASADARAAARARDEGDHLRARSLAATARAVLSQPLLPGIEAPWLDRRRDELMRVRVLALDVLGSCRLEAGEHADAQTAYEEARGLDPLDEVAWRGLMHAHAAVGRAAKALATYEELRALLAEELGADPSPETQELHARVLRGQYEVAVPLAPVAGDDQQRAPARTPYRGLEPFREQDADRFFGREQDTRELLDRLEHHRFVAVVGPSGSGKSSLVRAGLLHGLARGALPESDTWHRLTIVPGSSPLWALAGALLQLSPSLSAQQVTDRLRADPSELDTIISHLLAGQPSARQVVLVVDQFEEIFSLTQSVEERVAFCAALLDATRRPDGRTIVVLTMRADFLTQAAGEPRLAHALNTSQFLVGPLEPHGLERAIQDPLQQAGARLEDGLLTTILAEVVGQPGTLPLLQHALLELWDRRTGDGLLTKAAHEEAGGVRGAVARRAEAIHASLDSHHQQIVRRLMLRLTEPGEGTADTRRRATMDELAGIADPDHVEAVVTALAAGRLVTTDADPTGSRTVEVAHEALIRGWPRLAAWIDDDREGLRLHHRLTEASRDWERAGRDADLVWRGSRLEAARRWSEQHDGELTDVEAAFLESAVEAEQRAERRRRLGQRAVLIASLAVATVFGVLAWIATQQGDLARSRALAAESGGALDDDPEAALLLALEAWDTAPTPEAEAAVRAAHTANAIDWRSAPIGADSVPVVPGDEHVVAYDDVRNVVYWLDPDDGTVLTASDPVPVATLYWAALARDGRVALSTWDREVGTPVLDDSGRQIATLPYTLGVSWSPDDEYLVGSTFGDGMWVADGDSYEVRYTRPGSEFPTNPGGPHSRVAQRGTFSPDGRMLTFELGDPNIVRVVELATGEDDHVVAVGQLGGSAAFTPDGSMVAVEVDDQLVVLDTSTWKPVRGWDLDTDVIDLAWVDDRRLATLAATSVGAVRDVERGTVLPLLGLDQARRLEVVRDRLVLGIGQQAAVLWDPDTGTPVQRVVAAGVASNSEWAIGVSDTHLLVAEEGAVAAHRLETDRVVARPLEPARIFYGPWYDHVAGDQVVSLTMDLPGSLQLLDVTTMQVLADVPAASTRGGLDVSDDGATIVTTAGDDQFDLVVYDQRLQQVDRWTAIEDPAAACPQEECDIRAIDIGPDGKVAVASYGGRVRVFEADGTLVRDVDPAPEGAGVRVDVVFETPHTLLRAGSPDVPLARIHLEDGRVEPLPGHDGVETGIATRHPGSGRIAIGDVQARVSIWEPGAAEPEHFLQTDQGLAHLAFAGPGRILATSDEAVLWDLASGRPIASFGGHASELKGALWLGSGRVVTFGDAGDVRVHQCVACGPISEVVAQARASLTRTLTTDERRRHLG